MCFYILKFLIYMAEYSVMNKSILSLCVVIFLEFCCPIKACCITPETPSFLDQNVNFLCDCRPCTVKSFFPPKLEGFKYNPSQIEPILAEKNCVLMSCGLLALPVNCLWRTVTCPWQDSACCCDVLCARCESNCECGYCYCSSAPYYANKFGIRLKPSICLAGLSFVMECIGDVCS